MKHHRLIGIFGLASVTLFGCAANQNEGRDEHEEHEVKMSINDVPAPVRETLRRETNGAAITTVDREEKHGKTVYEADAVVDGKAWEIKVDQNGKLLGKRLETDDDEKDEHEGH